VTLFVWPENSRFSVSAQIVGEVIESIEKEEGEVTAAALVEVARPDDSPMHPAFEWEDKVAAESYRRDQARHLIRSVRVLKGSEVEQTPAFVRVKLTGDGEQRSVYIRTARAMSDEELRGQVLLEALTQLKAFRRRYEGLAALKPLWEVMDKVVPQ